MALANYEDLFVIPTSHKAYAEETFGEAHDAKSGCGFSFGNGCSTGTDDLNLFGAKKQTVKVVKPATFGSDINNKV